MSASANMYQHGQIKVEDDEEDLYAMVRLLCCEFKAVNNRVPMVCHAFPADLWEDAPKAAAKTALPEPVKQENAEFQDIYGQPNTGMQCL